MGLHTTAAELSAGERAVLMQLRTETPTEDGGIIGKAQRDALIRRGLAFRAYGWTTLTRQGFLVKCVLLAAEGKGCSPLALPGAS